MTFELALVPEASRCAKCNNRPILQSNYGSYTLSCCSISVGATEREKVREIWNREQRRLRAPEPEYTVTDARYAKGQKLLRVRSDGSGNKTRGDRLACALKGRWTHRERGYVLSPTKVARFEQYYAHGWDANFFTNELIRPKPSEADL